MFRRLPIRALRPQSLIRNFTPSFQRHGISSFPRNLKPSASVASMMHRVNPFSSQTLNFPSEEKNSNQNLPQKNRMCIGAIFVAIGFACIIEEMIESLARKPEELKKWCEKKRWEPDFFNGTPSILRKVYAIDKYPESARLTYLKENYTDEELRNIFTNTQHLAKLFYLLSRDVYAHGVILKRLGSAHLEKIVVTKEDFYNIAIANGRSELIAYLSLSPQKVKKFIQTKEDLFKTIPFREKDETTFLELIGMEHIANIFAHPDDLNFFLKDYYKSNIAISVMASLKDENLRQLITKKELVLAIHQIQHWELNKHSRNELFASIDLLTFLNKLGQEHLNKILGVETAELLTQFNKKFGAATLTSLVFPRNYELILKPEVLRPLMQLNEKQIPFNKFSPLIHVLLEDKLINASSLSKVVKDGEKLHHLMSIFEDEIAPEGERYCDDGYSQEEMLHDEIQRFKRKDPFGNKTNEYKRYCEQRNLFLKFLLTHIDLPTEKLELQTKELAKKSSVVIYAENVPKQVTEAKEEECVGLRR